MSAIAIRSNENKCIMQQKEEELLKNVTTAIKKPPNKFVLNEKVVSGKPLPGIAAHAANITFHGKTESNKQRDQKHLKNDTFTEDLPQMEMQNEDLDSDKKESYRSSQKEDFCKKKLERESEIKEIQEMLNKMISPQKCNEQNIENTQNDAKDGDSLKEADELLAGTGSVNEKKENNNVKNNHFYGRYKTELQLAVNPIESSNSRVTRKDTTRSCDSNAETHKARSNSSQLPLGSKEIRTNKKISYNPEEARRYMARQKKQRKLELFKDPSIKSKIEKEEIKKRLNELKTNSRKLIAENIKRKEKGIGEKSSTKQVENEILTIPLQQQRQHTATEKKRATVRIQNRETTVSNIKDSSLYRPLQRSLEKLDEKKQDYDSIRDVKVSSEDLLVHKHYGRLASCKKKESPDRDSSQRSSKGINNIFKAAPIPFVHKHERIGLLRRTEIDKDFSIKSNRSNFDKENQNLNMLTKQLLTAQENKINKSKDNTQNKELKERQPKAEGSDNEMPVYLEDEHTTGLQVFVSNLKQLKITEKNQPFIDKESSLNEKSAHLNELPFWLRPSATQVYPYNFIMAVRKKLESIDPLSGPKLKCDKQNKETSTTHLLKSPLMQQKRKSIDLLDAEQRKKYKRKPECNQKKAVERNLLKELNSVKESTFKHIKLKTKDIEINEYEKIKQNKTDNNKKTQILIEDEEKSVNNFKYPQKLTEFRNSLDNKNINKKELYIQQLPFHPLRTTSQSVSSDQEDCKHGPQQFKHPKNCKSVESLNSEINSNMSSISIPMPISNTLTEVSSLRTESRRTIAHLVRQPLTQTDDEVASISSQIFTSPKKTISELQKDFEFVKPRPVSPLSLEKVEKLKIERKQSVKEAEKNNREMDFTELLEDFNRSLSQVIQVNEQLKSSLDKSQQILSPQSSKKSYRSEKQYSSDFEKSSPIITLSSKDNNSLKESLQKNTENLKERRNQLNEIAEKIKPLLSPQVSMNVDKEEMIVLDKKQYSNLNLNLRSTNSAATTEHEGQKSPQSGLVSEGQSSSMVESQLYEKSLYETETLKETLKQTIIKSKKERKNEQRQEKQRIRNLTTRYSSPEIPSENKTKLKENMNERKHFSSNNNILTNSFNTYKTYKKYGKEHKGHKNIVTSGSENGSRSQTLSSSTLQDERKVNKKEHSIYNSNEMLPLNVNAACLEKSHEVTDHTILYRSESSKTISSLHKDNQALQHNNKSRTCANKAKGSEIESNGETQSDSTSNTGENPNSNTPSKASKRKSAISSSIAEELQKTYESGAYDHENIPLNYQENTQASKDLNAQIDSTEFIAFHINHSRGDFQDNKSEPMKFYETQFQQDIKATSHVSSTELAQNADDESTSSIYSNTCQEMDSNPSSYSADAIGVLSSKQYFSKYSPPKNNSRISISSGILSFFSRYDTGKLGRAAENNETMSESSLNYSNVGLYEKLIRNETNKSHHLSTLLKMREKALLDRTKGQIAWLEVQKARYKAKGFTNYIAAIRKRQRSILLKMEREREDIKRLLYCAASDSKTRAAQASETALYKIINQQNAPSKPKKELLNSTAATFTKPNVLVQHLTVKARNAQSSSPILKATYELEPSWAVEELLRKRENDLRQRREHVERLMQWHQRLDEEEAEVLNLERQLLSYNNVPHLVEELHPSKWQTDTLSAIKEKLTTPIPAAISVNTREQANISTSTKSPEKIRAARARKMEKRLKEIDQSLKELSHISASSTTSVVVGQTNNDREESLSSAVSQELDFVRTTGFKLNKLWKRLTSQQIEKFEPTRRYKLCKSDLEHLYEEAKMAVLRDFAEDEERIAKELLEKTASNLSSMTNTAGQVDLPETSTIDSKKIEMPMLNLNFSSGHSEAEEESANNSLNNATPQGNYSPSVAEQNFKAQVLLNSSASSESTLGRELQTESKQISRLESNVQMFLALSQRMQTCENDLQLPDGRHVSGNRLQRSLSDTEISEVPKYKADTARTSQTNIGTAASHSSSTITTNNSAWSFDASANHQRSKSSIVEISYIPSKATQPNYTNLSQIPSNSTDNFKGNKQLTNNSGTLSLVSSGPHTKSCQRTSSDIVSITEDTKIITKISNSSQRSTYSGQVGTNSETTAKEISSKLDEISAAVTQLSQMNALPSYESTTTQTCSKYNTLDERISIANDESNLSTDASSYSFNFENITTDKHSSPGTLSLNTYSLENKTLTSNTIVKGNVGHYSRTSESSSDTTLHTETDTGVSSSLASAKSKTFIKDDGKTSSKTLPQSMVENQISDSYEADFESNLSNLTYIEDITIPNFETTAEMTQFADYDGNDVANVDCELSSKSISNAENSDRDHEENISTKVSDKTYNVEEVNKSLSATNSEKTSPKADITSHKSSPDRELLPPPPPLPSPNPSSISPSSLIAASAVSIAATSNHTPGSHLMPDIINELELRRHQLILDNEQLKQYEHVTAVPYMYVREIPNKPPPPYVPPAHGSPMTTIFPSEDRIKDITFRRTHELYCELLKTEYCNEKGEKLPSVMEEQITNIYERIILDICREYLEENGEILRDSDPTNFHSQLAFFNPPNRLRCIQDAMYKEVRTCLAMDKTQPKRTQIYSVYGQRAKQDHIGKIIIQEMYDEDDCWCNFHREESEVLHLMVEEMINKNIVIIAKEVLLESGGIIDDNEQHVVEIGEAITEANAANHQAEATLQNCIHEDKQHQSPLQTSSVLMETLNEDNQTDCLNENEQDYTLLHQSNGNDPESNITANTNAVQTCT